ncbi:hypothetical protein FJTKL_07177 [Diaporthe vaccinii]|uniref:Uncharacterized protein n=1 Tax=Diaporthe vaccinii TaxID=105482 RepID=A0ABR4DPX8_9PEZI
MVTLPFSQATVYSVAFIVVPQLQVKLPTAPDLVLMTAETDDCLGLILAEEHYSAQKSAIFGTWSNVKPDGGWNGATTSPRAISGAATRQGIGRRSKTVTMS